MIDKRDKAVAAAMAYHQGNIAGLDDTNTRRLIASTVMTESDGGDLAITNRQGYIGRYQAGASWLADAGYIDNDKLRAAMAGYRSEWAWASAGRMTTFLNDSSNWRNDLNLEKYKASAELQDEAFRINSNNAYNQAIRNGVLHAEDSQENVAGFLKARHIAGYGGAVAAMTGGREVRDSNGTSNYDYMRDITHNRDGLSERMAQSQGQYPDMGRLARGRADESLRQGMEGDLVRDLQSQLGMLGYTDARGDALEIDGHYGNRTREAVTTFQRNNNLAVDGIAGPNTWVALREATRAASIIPAVAPAIVPAPTIELPSVRFPLLATPSGAEPSYSNPDHPQHALYARLKELLPPGTSEARLEQSTAACYMGQITQPEQLHEIHIVKGAVHFLTTRPDAYASIDLTQPVPAAQQTMQQVQAYDQRQTQMSAQFEMQRREINAPGGR